MIYITTALYAEAKPFIECFSLKKDLTQNKIQLFSSNTILLLVTGCGILNSAMALSRLLGALPPSYGDVFANIGICGGNTGGTFVCNKISSNLSNRSYYTDLIFPIPYENAEIISYITPQRDIPKNTLADTEAYGLAMAAADFFSAERMFFIKTVSDNGSFLSLTPKNVTDIISKTAQKTADLLISLPAVPIPFSFTSEEESLIAQYKLTVTQTHTLKTLLKYYKLKGGSIQNLLSACPQPKTKQQGRDLLDSLQKHILK